VDYRNQMLRSNYDLPAYDHSVSWCAATFSIMSSLACRSGHSPP